MRLYHDMREFDAPGCVLALGTFDGVHLGHQALLRACTGLAREKGLPAVVMTFDRHPLALLRPEIAPKALTEPEEKRRLIAALGLDAMIEQPFTAEYAAQTPRAFAEGLARWLRPDTVVVGFNYSFGRGGQGNPQKLAELGKELGFAVAQIAPVLLDEEPVSSTRIRRLIAEGRIREAARLTGRTPAAET